jgi:hypothetical protein
MQPVGKAEPSQLVQYFATPEESDQRMKVNGRICSSSSRYSQGAGTVVFARYFKNAPPLWNHRSRSRNVALVRDKPHLIEYARVHGFLPR